MKRRENNKRRAGAHLLLFSCLFTLHPTPYTLRFTLYTFYSSLITHSLYLKLRFPSLVPYIYTSDKRPRINQRRTKEQPKNPKIQKVLFVKIAISFPFLIPCLIPPTDDRENTERRAKLYRALALRTPHFS